MTWVSPATNYSYTGTLTGLTATVTGTITYTQIGDVVTVDIPSLSGTSNETTMTLTGGTTNMRPAATKTVLCSVADNSIMTVGIVNIETTGTLTFFREPSGTGFTASGTKGISRLSFSYTLV